MTDQSLMDVNTTNTTTSPILISELVPFYDIFYYMTVSFHAITFVFGILSNSIYCTVIIRYPKFRKPFNLLAFALAVSDLLASLISVPLVDALVNYHYKARSLQTPICKASVLVMNILKWFSVLLMTEIAIIRAKSVLSTVRWTIQEKHIVVMVLLNISVIIPLSIHRAFLTESNICYPADSNLNALLNMSVFISFFTILFLGYVIIIIEAKRRAALMPQSSRNRGATKFEISTIQACAAVVGTYIVCHAPCVTFTALVYEEVVPWSYFYHSLMEAVFQLPYVFDSLILTVSSSEYRKHIVGLLSGVRRRSPNRPNSTSESTDTKLTSN